MMAEGNRSFSGETGFISPNTASLARKSGAGLITYRLHGGYLVNPRWSKEVRKGPVWGEVTGQYTHEELSAMNDAQIAEIIMMRPTKFPEIPVSLERNTEVFRHPLL